MHKCNIAHTNLTSKHIIKFDNTYKVSGLKHSIDFDKFIPNKYNIERNHLHAPEILESNQENISLAIDIWSFGVLL